MAELKNYGYIILGNDYDAKQHHAKISSPNFNSTVICTETVSQAIDIAQQMVNDGIEVIELCGGFGQSGAFQIVNAINCKVPVGFVSFAGYEHDKLTDFLTSE